MDFFKIKKFGKGKKGAWGGGEIVESDDEANAALNVASEEQQKGDIFGEKAEEIEGAGTGNGVLDEAEEEDDDDDFITNEVKRRLKELRKNSFMVLIPEEECAEVEEDGGEEGEEEGSSSREWLESDVGDGFPLCGFDSLYDKYCERMLVFHKMIAQLMKDPGERSSQFWMFLSICFGHIFSHSVVCSMLHVSVLLLFFRFCYYACISLVLVKLTIFVLETL
jgi:hypothetical protein